MNNAAKGLRRAISNVDMNVIAPTISDTFTNEMLYNPDESIKGDCVVVPRGAAAILIRESMQQRRLQYLTIISNPLIAQVIGNKYIVNTLRQVAEAMELPVDEMVPTDDELAQREAAAAQAAQQQAQQMQQMQAAELEQKLMLEQAKEEAKGAREAASKTQDIIGEVVKQAVANAMASSKDAEAKKPKKVRYEYNDAGELVGGEME
jgi:hypothetical protein